MMMRSADDDDGNGDQDDGPGDGILDYNPQTWCLALMLPPSSRAPCRPTEARSGELRRTEREDY